ncbi:DUF6519 domain-containing protein [uncultured Microbacterium sp.]|uniref:DUF6519 domain-containing protein n=1 Tax=uncultured Microbacterium sp. TaxID=191216 RepID=UPI002620712D|nr:DUF6519 domain-containing protein [uncultured Microbacterium sp.]
MNGDYSRRTHDPRDGDSAVLLQQGRILTDADWNEQSERVARRIQSEALDTIGRAGVPSETPDGFKITLDAGGLTIGVGRMYVDGVSAENWGGPADVWRRTLAELVGTTPVPYASQPHLIDPPAVSLAAKVLVYLKVWRREVTAIDDPELIEPALAIDTTTRLRTIWQVKAIEVPAGFTAGSPFESLGAFTAAEPPATSRLTVATATVDVDPSPCLIAPTGGYTGVENHLYRIQVHAPGAAGAATFTWSRDDATVAARVTSIPATLDRIVVDRLGPDDVLSFHDGEWVELIDEARELSGRPGILRRIVSGGGVDEATRTLLLTQPLAAGDVALSAQGAPLPGTNLRVRRWDQGTTLFDEAGAPVADPALANGAITIPPPGTTLLLEHNLTVAFSSDPAGGLFRTGDHWLVPARTDDPNGHEATAIPAAGIHAHYAALALIDGGTITDLRPVFPPLAGMESVFYVAGDGQEVTPDLIAPAPVVLPVPPTVGVSRGAIPVAGRAVRFTRTGGGGTIDGVAGPVTVSTAADGTADVAWAIDPMTDTASLEARLLDASGQPVGLPVRFSARTRHAATVAYQPGACPDLAGASTVQEALDILCRRSPGGGGCCATVGDGGQYERIEEAIRDLAERRKGHVCICLLPGDHRYEHDRIDFVRELSIHGCGARVHLGRPLEVAGAEEVHLAEVEFIGSESLQDHLILLEGVGSTSFDSLRVRAKAVEVATLVHLVGCGQTRVDDCTLASTAPARDGGRPRFTGVVHNLLTALRDADVPALEVAVDGNRRSAIARRRVAAGQLDDFATSPEGVASPRLAKAAIAAAELVRTGAAADRFEPLRRDLGDILGNVDAAKGAPRAALSLEAPRGATWVRGNTFAGGLSLYGVTSPDRIDELEARFDDLLAEAREPFDLDTNALPLVVTGNTLAWTLLATHPREVVAFGSAAFGENRVRSGPAELAAGRTTLTGNILDRDDGLLAGLVYADVVTATGNVGAGQRAVLVLSSAARGEAANAGLTVLP